MTFRNLFALTCLILCVSVHTCSAANADKPNVVYMMLDELGYFELSCMGHPVLETPNFDRIVNEGMRFEQCLAGAIGLAASAGAVGIMAGAAGSISGAVAGA